LSTIREQLKRDIDGIKRHHCKIILKVAW
jgi:hypothetical protein